MAWGKRRGRGTTRATIARPYRMGSSDLVDLGPENSGQVDRIGLLEAAAAEREGRIDRLHDEVGEASRSPGSSAAQKWLVVSQKEEIGHQKTTRVRDAVYIYGARPLPRPFAPERAV